MKLPKINVKLVQEVMDWIDFKAGTEGYPAWLQAFYSSTRVPSDVFDKYRSKEETEQKAAAYEKNYCGTAFCVAGFVAREYSGRRPGFGNAVVLPQDTVITNHLGEEYLTGWTNDWLHAGRHLLGLTTTEAEQLFDGGNSKARIRELFNKFLEARGEAVRV